MRDWADSLIVKMGILRQERIALMEEGFGSALNVLGAFVYQAQLWKRSFALTLPLRDDDWLSPTTSKHRALDNLSEDSIATAWEVSEALRSGLIRPAEATLRKLYEIRIDTEFIKLDPTGSVAHRWLHWVVERKARLRPDIPDIRQKASVSRHLFGNEDTYGKNGAWAKLPDGKIYTSSQSRIDFVARKKKEDGLDTTDIEEIKDAEKAFLDITNAQSHPTSVGPEGILFIGIIIYLVAYHTYNTLVVPKVGIDEALHIAGSPEDDPMLAYPTGHIEIASLWGRVEELVQVISDMAAKWRAEAQGAG